MKRTAAGALVSSAFLGLTAVAASAAPTLSPSSGPSGTRVRVVDPSCSGAFGPTLSLISFVTTDRSGQVVDSGGPPPGGRFVIDAPGTGIVSGPPGEYPFSPGCALAPTLTSSGIPTTSSPLTFTLTGTPGPAPAAAPDAPAADHQAPAAGGGSGGSGGSGTVAADPEMGERARARASEVQERTAERQAGIDARAREREQALAARAVERAERSATRDAAVAARAVERAERAAERSLR